MSFLRIIFTIAFIIFMTAIIFLVHGIVKKNKKSSVVGVVFLLLLVACYFLLLRFITIM